MNKLFKYLYTIRQFTKKYKNNLQKVLTKTNGSGIIKTTKKEKQNKREHKKFSKEILSEREFQKNLRKGGTIHRTVK